METENAEENQKVAAPLNPVADSDGYGAIMAIYNRETAVDNVAVYRRQYDSLHGYAVDASLPETIVEGKQIRAKLNLLAKRIGESRMVVQRAIKKHPIGQFAFTKSELEKSVEIEAKRLDADLKKAENAPRHRMNAKVETFVCYVTGTLAEINKLAVVANERGLEFENHGPVMDPPPLPNDAPNAATQPEEPMI